MSTKTDQELLRDHVCTTISLFAIIATSPANAATHSPNAAVTAHA